MEIINTLNSIEIKKPKKLFKEPNSSCKYYGKDVAGTFSLGNAGSDIFTSHISQNTDWSLIDFIYQWNSIGLRGPEPEYTANKKIIFAGGSLSLGTGVPVEHSFPYILSQKMGASYINLSDVDTLSDLIEPLAQFKNFNPDIVIINDTRFIQLYGWALIDIYKMRNVESNPLYKSVFSECDKNFLLMFESYLQTLFPNAKLVLAHCVRRAFREMPTFQKMITVKLEKKLVVDIARDNAHPGIESHKNFAEEIYKIIN